MNSTADNVKSAQADLAARSVPSDDGFIYQCARNGAEEIRLSETARKEDSVVLEACGSIMILCTAKTILGVRISMNSTNASRPLPDTSAWQPRDNKLDTLKSAFLKRCISVETLITSRANLEKGMNIDNFDSGLGVEDIIREEIRQLLPTRYSVTAGVVNDRNGKTAGDIDLVIFNSHWFPLVKAGATPESRRAHLPIDGAYAVCEVKQSLDCDVLDEAMEKLVMCHRLYRSQTYAYRTTENREGSSCIHGLTNPLYSMIIATDLRKGVEFNQLIERFFDINRSLHRPEVIRALCVLGYGTVTWGYWHSETESRPALFMLEDLYEPIFPVYHKTPESESALYSLMVDLFLHLYHSVLAPEDIVAHYGPQSFRVKIPTSPDIVLAPDAQRLSILNKICDLDHTLIRPRSANAEHTATKHKRKKKH